MIVNLVNGYKYGTVSRRFIRRLQVMPYPWRMLPSSGQVLGKTIHRWSHRLGALHKIGVSTRHSQVFCTQISGVRRSRVTWTCHAGMLAFFFPEAVCFSGAFLGQQMGSGTRESTPDFQRMSSADGVWRRVDSFGFLLMFWLCCLLFASVCFCLAIGLAYCFDSLTFQLSLSWCLRLHLQEMNEYVRWWRKMHVDSWVCTRMFGWAPDRQIWFQHISAYSKLHGASNWGRQPANPQEGTAASCSVGESVGWLSWSWLQVRSESMLSWHQTYWSKCCLEVLSSWIYWLPWDLSFTMLLFQGCGQYWRGILHTRTSI